MNWLIAGYIISYTLVELWVILQAISTVVTVDSGRDEERGGEEEKEAGQLHTLVELWAILQAAATVRGGEQPDHSQRGGNRMPASVKKYRRHHPHDITSQHQRL